MKLSLRPNACVMRLSLASVSLLVLSACVVAPAHYRPVAAGPAPVVASSDLVVTVAPPAPYVEVIPPRINMGHVWLPGFWAWQGGRHQWVAGRWEAPPAGRHNWVQHRWVQDSHRGWLFQQGHWR